MQILSNMTAVHDAIAAAASGTSDVNGNVIAIDGAQGAECVALFGTAAAGGLKCQTGDQPDGSDMTDLEGSSVDAAAGETLVRLCVHKFPSGRKHHRFVARRPSATTLVGATSHRYGLRQQPPADAQTEGTTKVVVSAEDGAA